MPKDNHDHEDKQIERQYATYAAYVYLAVGFLKLEGKEITSRDMVFERACDLMPAEIKGYFDEEDFDIVAQDITEMGELFGSTDEGQWLRQQALNNWQLGLEPLGLEPLAEKLPVNLTLDVKYSPHAGYRMGVVVQWGAYKGTIPDIFSFAKGATLEQAKELMIASCNEHFDVQRVAVNLPEEEKKEQ